MRTRHAIRSMSSHTTTRRFDRSVCRRSVVIFHAGVSIATFSVKCLRVELHVLYVCFRSKRPVRENKTKTTVAPDSVTVGFVCSFSLYTRTVVWCNTTECTEFRVRQSNKFRVVRKRQPAETRTAAVINYIWPKNRFIRPERYIYNIAVFALRWHSPEPVWKFGRAAIHIYIYYTHIIRDIVVMRVRAETATRRYYNNGARIYIIVE